MFVNAREKRSERSRIHFDLRFGRRFCDPFARLMRFPPCVTPSRYTRSARSLCRPVDLLLIFKSSSEISGTRMPYVSTCVALIKLETGGVSEQVDSPGFDTEYDQRTLLEELRWRHIFGVETAPLLEHSRDLVCVFRIDGSNRPSFSRISGRKRFARSHLILPEFPNPQTQTKLPRPNRGSPLLLMSSHR